MKKSISKKLLALLMVLALIIGCTVGGTLAWLITSTDPVVNTFTAGNVDISLVEHELDLQTGVHASPEKWVTKQKGEIELLPGRNIYKDPTVIVGQGSEPCYVRMFMVIDYGPRVDAVHSIDDMGKWFDYNEKWKLAGAWLDRVSGTYGHVLEFQYDGLVNPSADEDTFLPPLFNHIIIDKELTGEEFACLEEVELIFIAQAVQKRNGLQPFENIAYPDLELDMIDGRSLTLAELIESNSPSH